MPFPSFSIDFTPRIDGDWAYYDNAMLFEAGDYPDKGFTIGPEELAEAIDDFKPITGNLDHTEWLDGHACAVDAAWIDPADPWRVRGRVRVPRWLDSVLKPTQRKLSVEWDPDTRRLSAIALTPNPRIKDAALVSAFSEAQRTGSVRMISADPQEVARLKAMMYAFAKGPTDEQKASALERARRAGYKNLPPRPMDQAEHQARLDRLHKAGYGSNPYSAVPPRDPAVLAGDKPAKHSYR